MLLDWLCEPRTDRGVRFLANNGEWRFRSYAQLALDIRRMAYELRSAGGIPGDVVAIVTGDPEEFIPAFMGVLAAGMVPSPLAPPSAFRDLSRYQDHLSSVIAVAQPTLVCGNRTSQPPLAAAADHAGTPVTFVDIAQPASMETGATQGPWADQRAPQRAFDEIALLQFTSGSSGSPKAVRVSWTNLMANVAAIRSWLRWSERDVFANWLPLHHDMGLIGGMITPIVTGTDLWLMTPRQFIRQPRRWLECFGLHGATLTTAPNFGYAHVVRRVAARDLTEMDFSGWRVAILGAERIDSAIIAGFHKLTGPRGFAPESLIAAYGLAENTLVATGTRPGGGSRLAHLKSTALAVGDPVTVIEHAVLGTDTVEGGGWLTSCGQPVDGTDLAVVDGEGNELPPGTFGEIRLTGDSLARGYLSQEGTEPFGPEGLRTGDAGFMLDNELFVVGRIAEAMKVRGGFVHAEDIEAELIALDRSITASIAVTFGSADGTELAAIFVEGELPQGWAETAAQRLRDLALPSVEVLVLQGGRGAIARTSSGKPRRRLMWGQLIAPPAMEVPKWSLAYRTPLLTLS
ncbi:AMP-binding protein [Streptomyces sp. NPDC054765]